MADIFDVAANPVADPAPTPPSGDIFDLAAQPEEKKPISILGPPKQNSAQAAQPVSIFSPKKTFHGEPQEPIAERPGEPGLKETLGFGEGGYGAYIPHTGENAPWSEQVNNGAIRFLSGMLSPKAAAETLGFMVGGEALPALANLPKVASALKEFPSVLKALDIASKAGVPAATVGTAAVSQYQQGVPKNVEDAVVAAGNALVAGLGTYGAIKAGRAALAAYPKTPSSSVSVPGTSQTIPAEQIGGIPTVNPATASATASALEAGGQRLAAQAWRNVNVQAPTEIPTDQGKVYLQPRTSVTTSGGKRLASATILDASGQIVVSGPPSVVRDWLDTHTAAVSGGLRAGATSATVVNGAKGPISTEISTPVIPAAAGDVFDAAAQTPEQILNSMDAELKKLNLRLLQPITVEATE